MNRLIVSVGVRTCLHRCTVHGLMLGPTIVYRHRHWMTEPVIHDLHPLIWMHLMELILLEIVLPWLGLGIFNKIDITQGGLL